MSDQPKIRLVNITLVNFLARIIFYVFVFATGYVTSRALTKIEFGQIQYIAVWVNLSWMFFNLGVPNTLSRYLTQAFLKHHTPGIKKLMWYAAAGAVLTFAATIGLFSFLYHKVAIDLPFLPAIVFALSQAVVSYLQVIIQSVYRYKATFWVNLFACIIGIIFLIATVDSLGGAAYLYTFITVNLILIAGYGICIFQSFARLGDGGDQLELPGNRLLLRSSLFYAVSAILSGMLWQRFELSVLKAYFNYDLVAVYGIGFSVISLFAEPLKLIPGTLLYYFAGLGNDQEEASRQFGRFFSHYCWLVIFMGAFIWFDAEHVITIIYTEKYIHSTHYLKILLLGMVPGVCSYVLKNIHVGLGRARFLLILDIAGAALFLGLMFLLIPVIDLSGAAWAKTTAIVFTVIAGLGYTYYRLGYAIPVKQIFWSFIVSVALTGPLQYMFSDNIGQLLVKGLILFVVYFTISWYAGIIERDLILRIWKDIKAKFTR